MTKSTNFAASLLALSALGASLPVSAQDAPPSEAVESDPVTRSVGKKVETVEGELLETMMPNFPNRNPDAPTLTNWREARPKQADYPAEAWLAGDEGVVKYQIAVDAEGKATKCSISASSGVPALDMVTCTVLMARAQFEPRINEEGEAIAGVYEGRHRWRKREPEITGSFRFVANFVIDEQGVASQCEVEALEGTLPRGMAKSIEKNPCPFGSRSSRIPFRDENGVPIAKRVSVEFAAQVSDVEPKAED